jgi:glycosyltransferase involved in cell wall biosynthesis
VRGTPLAVLAMVRALAGLGHAVELLTYPQGEEVAVPGVVHRRSLRLPVGRVRAGASLAKLALDVPFLAEAAWRLASGRFDVVHAVEEAAHLIAPFARLLGKPLVMDVDSSIPSQLRESRFARGLPLPWLAEAFENHALRHSARVITVCSALSDGVREKAPEAALHQIEDPPLVEPAAAPDAAEIEGLRGSLGLSALPVVLYSGNFEPYQGVELLVDAAALCEGAQFLFMGGEPHEIAALRARAQAAGARCAFAGKRPPSELGRFLALASIVASPRRTGAHTPFKIYTYIASAHPHPDPRRLPRLPRGALANRARPWRAPGPRGPGRGGAPRRPRPSFDRARVQREALRREGRGRLRGARGGGSPWRTGRFPVALEPRMAAPPGHRRPSRGRLAGGAACGASGLRPRPGLGGASSLQPPGGFGAAKPKAGSA